MTAPHSRPGPPASRCGFTLIELLVVMVIIIILSSLLVPPMKNISGANSLTSSTEEFASSVSFARQRASSFNRPVSIRFFIDRTANEIYSYQLWEQKESSDANSWAGVDRERKLPNNIKISNDLTYSTLLAREPIATMPAPDNRRYHEVFFTPAGALVATTGQTSITFVPRTGAATGGMVNGLPPNFGVVDIQPMNAIPTIYRPQ